MTEQKIKRKERKALEAEKKDFEARLPNVYETMKALKPIISDLKKTIAETLGLTDELVKQIPAQPKKPGTT